eukprot:COSAG05_NODE_130_length_17165_cov_154.623638_9_plen_173_part_00
MQVFDLQQREELPYQRKKGLQLAREAVAFAWRFRNPCQPVDIPHHPRRTILLLCYGVVGTQQSGVMHCCMTSAGNMRRHNSGLRTFCVEIVIIGIYKYSCTLLRTFRTSACKPQTSGTSEWRPRPISPPHTPSGRCSCSLLRWATTVRRRRPRRATGRRCWGRWRAITTKPG